MPKIPPPNTGTFPSDEQLETERKNRCTHTVYENGDVDAPDSIKDMNGDIVLGLCKICGAGESELYERPCPILSGVPSPDFLSRIVNIPQPHDNHNPLWEGPWGSGQNGGVTQSMIVRFLSCRDRFRLRYVLGLEPYPKWNHKVEYGNMWHICEEAFARESDWVGCLDSHVTKQEFEFPLQREDIAKWHNVCMVQFPEYIKYWSEHPDVKNRTPLLQEEVFDVPYTLPSGRTIRLRGKWDSVDLIKEETEGKLGRHQKEYQGIYIQENKTKGDVDKVQIERQLKYDLQSNFYLISLKEWQNLDDYGIPVRFSQAVENPVCGVRYNVVRRPFSGGKGNISPHKAKYTKKGVTLAETSEHFYERLRQDYFVKEPDYWFFRVRAEISQDDLNTFRRETLDPILEQICVWYEQVTGKYQSFRQTDGKTVPQLNYRTPFGTWNSLQEGGFTEYDSFLETGSEAGLRRVNSLFEELK